MPGRPAPPFAAGRRAGLGRAAAFANGIERRARPGLWLYGFACTRFPDGTGIGFQSRRYRGVGILAIKDEYLAQVLDWSTLDLLADQGQERIAGRALWVCDPHLDQLMLQEREVNFVQHRRCHPMLSDRDNRIEMMRAGAQSTAC